MSSFAAARFSVFVGRRGSPPAGETGRKAVVQVSRAFGQLKTGTARVHPANNDLHVLALENGTSVRESEVFSRACCFLFALPGYLPSPELTLDDDGEISFFWSGDGKRMLTVSLRADGRLSYAARLSALDRQHGTKPFTDEIPRTIVECIQQVAGD